MSSHVDVTGTGRATAVPDVVTLDVRVTCDGPDVAGTLRDASAKVAELQQAARAQGVGPADLQTSGSGVHQRWANDRPEVVGYTAFHSLRVRVRDLDSIGTLVSAFSEAAGNALGIDNIALTISNPEPLAEQAREAAFENARAKALQYATLARMTLGDVMWVSDLPAGSAPVMRQMKLAAMDMAASMPIEAGESSVVASVAVRWAWSA
jgi:uncharacterized protein YggE